MYQYKGMDDTIVAISTALAPGGIGIVRLSGKEAISIAGQIFVAKNENAGPTSQFKTHTIHYGHIVVRNELIDEVLLTIMRAPQSYTVEDVVEISCHGGLTPVKRILTVAMELGARLAEPGEFTKRAFLNGRIDLTQAEAVLDIIQAKTEAFLKVSTHQLKGELTTRLENIRAELINVYIELEAVVNFPEDDIDDRGKKIIHENLQKTLEYVEQLMKTSEEGRVLREGIKIVLCGKPNVGKSSLLNVFLQQPRAIVSEIAGTTRDTIEETMQIDGIPFQVVDTAGILKPRDAIEQEAIKRSRLYIEQADLILFLVDASCSVDKEDLSLFITLKDKNVLVIANKADLTQKNDPQSLSQSFPTTPIIFVSALKQQGIDSLKQNIVQHVLHGKKIDTQGLMITNVRHIQSLRKTADGLQRALQNLDQGISWEFISEEIKSAVNELDAITGRNIDIDLLDKIFADFCIGK